MSSTLMYLARGIGKICKGLPRRKNIYLFLEKYIKYIYISLEKKALVNKCLFS